MPLSLKIKDRSPKASVTNETVAVTQDESPFLIRTAPYIRIKSIAAKRCIAQVNISNAADMNDSNGSCLVNELMFCFKSRVKFLSKV